MGNMIIENARGIVEYKNKKLNAVTKSIITENNKVGKSLVKVAYLLAQVKESKCYEEDGFKSVAEYAEEAFGYKRAMVYKMVKMANTFINTDGTVNLISERGEYNATQLIELSSAESIDEVREMNDEETITPEMTVKEIKQALNDRFNEAETENEVEAETENENEVEAENEKKILTPSVFAEFMSQFSDVEDGFFDCRIGSRLCRLIIGDKYE